MKIAYWPSIANCLWVCIAVAVIACSGCAEPTNEVLTFRVSLTEPAESGILEVGRIAPITLSYRTNSSTEMYNLGSKTTDEEGNAVFEAPGETTAQMVKAVVTEIGGSKPQTHLFTDSDLSKSNNSVRVRIKRSLLESLISKTGL